MTQIQFRIITPIRDDQGFLQPPNVNLEEDIQVLEDAGMIGRANHISIAELLKPEGETLQFSGLGTPEEIFAQFQAIDEEYQFQVEKEAVPKSAEVMKALSLWTAYREGTNHKSGIQSDASMCICQKDVISYINFENKKQTSISDFFTLKRKERE